MTASASFNPQQMIDTVVALVAAYALALPLGWERKTKGEAHIGLRTLPLVSVGTCAYLLLARFLFERDLFDADGMARTLRAVMTGIGFIGGGAILKHASSVKGVKGVTTAASVWSTGAIAASVAHGYYSIAVALSVTSLFVVEISGRFTARVESPTTADTR